MPVPGVGGRRRDGPDRRLSGAIQRPDARRRRGHRLPPRHRPAGRDPAAQAGRVLRRQVPERGPGGGAAAVRHLRIERSRPLHHRRAGRLSADQAGDEPGLRSRRIHPRQPRRAGRRAAAQGQVREFRARAHRQRGTLAAAEERAAAGRHHDAAAARVPARQRHPDARARHRRLQPQRLYEHLLLDRRGRGRHRAQRRHAGCPLDRPSSRRFLRRTEPDLRAPPRGNGEGRAGLRAGRNAAPHRC